MSESFQSRLARWQFNLFPAYRRTGGRVTYIAADYHELHIKLPLNWKTRNYVGSLFGGSIYGAVDPILMIMFLRLLGKDYIVWDKAAAIRYRRPGRSALTARFRIEEEELQAIRDTLQREEKIDREFRVSMRDADGQVCAEIDKVLHFRRKRVSSEKAGR